MDKLKGYKTVIVFGAILLNGILNQLGWGLELPPALADKAEIILAAVALVLRFVTTSAVGKK